MTPAEADAVVDTTAQGVLRVLAAHYERHPGAWRQDAIETPDTFCILHGVRRFTPRNVNSPGDVIYAARYRLQKHIKGVHSVATWNDHVAKSVDEVIDLLRKAAK